MSTVPVNMPQLTMAAQEATFLQWLAADGDTVTTDQPLYLVATDKVETEVPSPATGTLHHGKAEPEQTYQVGTQLATIDTTT